MMRRINTMSEEVNRRVDKRISQKEALKLSIIFSSENPGLLGKTLKGSTIDISASGLRITLGTALPPNSTIDMSITLKDDPEKYFLSGKVRWCRAAEDEDEEGMYHVGIVLQDLINTETDYKRWRKSFKS